MSPAASQMARNSRPTTEWLLAHYVAGNLPLAGNVLVACFLELNPAARAAASRLETVGGWLLESASPVSMAPERSAEALLDTPGASRISGNAEPLPSTLHSPALPAALAGLVPAPPRADDWTWRAPGVFEHRMKTLESGGMVARLLRIEPGHGIPQHTHDGLEATLVLDGAYDDVTGRYVRGDLELADGDLGHRPVATPGRPCICFAVSEAPIRLTGAFGRMLNLLNAWR